MVPLVLNVRTRSMTIYYNTSPTPNKRSILKVNKELFESQLSSNAPIISSNIVALLPDNIACFYVKKLQKVIFYFRLRP